MSGYDAFEANAPIIAAPGARRAARRYAVLAVLALLPGVALFGFRAFGVIAAVVLLHRLANRCIRRRGGTVAPAPEPRWLDALLVCAFLPAEGLSAGSSWQSWRWPILFVAPVLLALLGWLRTSRPRVPFDAVVGTALLLHVTLGTAMSPNASLEPNDLFRGDVMAAVSDPVGAEPAPWYARANPAGAAARATPWAAERLDAYLSRRLPNTNLDSLIRDALPPIEDLVLLGHPTPIGMASGVVLLALILWGAFHRSIDWRIPLVALAACYVTLIVLPVPSSVDVSGHARWRLAAAWRADIGPATALTFIHYLMLASPALFTLGLLAPRGENRPVQPPAVLPWSFCVGVLTAVLTLYVSVSFGPLLAMLAAPCGARMADRIFAQRPLRLPD